MLKKFRFYLLISIVFFVILFFFHSFFLESMAKFLIVSDPLQKADAIIVVSGDSNGERIRQGAELYRQGMGDYFLVSGGYVYWRVTLADLMRKHANALGVPLSAIIIEDQSQSTYENAKFSLPILQKLGVKSVIIVTSPTHTRRLKGVFQKVFGKAGIKVMICPAKNSKFNADKWWTRNEDGEEVAMEYVKLVSYTFKGWK